MTPATEAKADAILAAIIAPPFTGHKAVAILLAMLTSANKDEREKAKQNVRDLVRVGATIQVKHRTAADLAERANHFEP